MTTKQETVTATATGRYLTEYDRIVRPQHHCLLPNYFIDHWLSRLGPTFAWMVISLKQACWRENAKTCTISQAAIAEKIGPERRTVGRVLLLGMRSKEALTVLEELGPGAIGSLIGPSHWRRWCSWPPAST